MNKKTANNVTVLVSEEFTGFDLDGERISLDESVLFWVVGDEVVYYNLPDTNYMGSSHLEAENFGLLYKGTIYKFSVTVLDSADLLYDIVETW